MTAEQTAIELQRKKNAGIAPTSAANNTAYKALTAQPVSATTVGGAMAGAMAGLPNGSIPQPSGPALNGSIPSGGGGFMGIPNAMNIAQATNPISAAAAAGNANVSTPSTPVSAPAPTPVAAQPTAQPMSASVAQQPAPDYAALAAARTALALQQKTTIANQQKASAQTAYDQQNLRTKDDRVLGDFNRTQTANPFANMGRTSFNEGLVGRERTQADADASAALATQKGNIDQMLADYQNATEDEKVRIADELQRADRDYNLNLAKFNQDQSNYDKTFNQQQQQIDYSQSPTNPNNVGQNLSNAGQALTNQLSELKLGNYSEEQKKQATLYEQQVKSGQMSNEAAAYNLAQLKDPNSTKNQADKIDLQLKQLDLKNAPEKDRLELQQLQKQIAEIGKVHYKPQTQTEIDTDVANLKILQGKVNAIGKTPALTGAEANNQYTSEVVTNVDKMTPDNRKLFFTNEKAALIAKLGKPAYDNLYNDYYNTDGTPK